jgi:hypothetical protein
MKQFVTVLGVLGLADAVLLPLASFFGVEDVPVAYAWIGYLGACVCFGALAVIDAVKGTDKPPLP